MRVLSAWLGLALERVSLSESLAAANILCIRRVTLRLGVELQRHFVRSSDSEDGAVGDALGETGGGLVLVTWHHLAFACRKPWWRTQDGDQAKRLGITLVLV